MDLLAKYTQLAHVVYFCERVCVTISL